MYRGWTNSTSTISATNWTTRGRRSKTGWRTRSRRGREILSTQRHRERRGSAEKTVWGLRNRGQTGLPANFRQKAPEIHGSLVSPRGGCPTHGRTFSKGWGGIWKASTYRRLYGRRYRSS